MHKFPRLHKKNMRIIKERLFTKANASRCEFRISAIAFDKRGEFIGQAFNSRREGLKAKYGKGRGVHAEMKLMHEYGNRIKTIVISRIGNGGDWLPIKCCPKCQAVANKLGITVFAIDECFSE